MSIIVGGALGLTLAASVGVGVAVGSNTEFKEARAATSLSTLNFTEKCNGSGTADDGATWTVTSDAAESTFEETKGIHYGTNNAKVSYLRLNTTSFTTQITKIVVNASSAKEGAKLNVTVNNSNFGTQQSLRTSDAAYTFTGSATGNIQVSISQKSAKKALYCKSIAVTYAVPEVSSITVGGAMTKTVYYEGDNWDSTGLTVTANFTDNTSRDVTSSASWSFNPASANSTSIKSVVATATYDGKTAQSSEQFVTVNEIVTRTYNLVNSQSDLVVGAKYLIASAVDSGNAMFMSEQGSNNRSVVSAPVASNIATITTQQVAEVTLGGTANAYTLLTDDGYLYAAGADTNNYLRSRSNNSDDNGVWTIAINSGVATINANGVSTRNIMRYNSTNELISCYASGQQDLYLYRSESAYATSIAVNGAMSLTTYTTASQWDPSGLTVTATMSDSSTEDITDKVTWSFDPATPAEGVTSVVATATYVELSANSAAQSVTVVAVTSPYVNDVPYKMYIPYNNSKYYFTGEMTGYYGKTTQDVSKAVDVYFEANGSGQNIYFMANEIKNYFVVQLNETHINFVYSDAIPTIPWQYNGKLLTYTIDETPYTYSSYVKTGHFFDTFSAAPTSYDNFKVQFDLSTGNNAESFASLFLSEILCDSTGASAPAYRNVSIWNDLFAVYSQLDDTEKLALKNAAANESGTTVEQAMARYDYIVAKYAYTNFINRSISKSANRMIGIIDNNSVVMIAVVMGLLATTGFAAFYMLRKKKLD